MSARAGSAIVHRHLDPVVEVTERDCFGACTLPAMSSLFPLRPAANRRLNSAIKETSALLDAIPPYNVVKWRMSHPPDLLLGRRLLLPYADVGTVDANAAHVHSCETARCDGLVSALLPVS